MNNQQQNRPTRRLLRTKEAATYLGISPWKLRDLVRDGKLPVIRDADGGAFLLDIRDLDKWIETRKETL